MVSVRCITASVCVFVCTLSTFCAGQHDFYQTFFISSDLLNGTTPDGIVAVLYKGGVSVNMCNDIDPRKLRERPTFAWEYKEGVKYTLIMLDLDVPSREMPVMRCGLHMLVMNITNNDVYDPTTDVLYEYIGPNPFPFSGLHRYLFLVYEQGETTPPVGLAERFPMIGRLRFNLGEFVKNHNLIGPVAGNCCICEFSGF